jgi:hypothetical protein
MRFLPLMCLLALGAAPARAAPLQIFTGIHVIDLRSIDIEEQSFSALVGSLLVLFVSRV